MKKEILALSLICAIAFFACKKDRTCSCTVTKTGTSKTTGKVSQVLFGFPVDLADTTFTQPLNEITTQETQLRKVTKKTAKNNCYSYSEPYKVKMPIAVPASSFNLVVEVTEEGTIDYSCKLK